MKASIKFGFPIVIRDDVHAVWISTEYVPGLGQAFWNRQSLSQTEPFGSNAEDLNTFVSRIAATNRNVFFQCSGVNPDASGAVVIAGTSFGLALTIATHFDVPEGGNDPILLSGRVAVENDRPLPNADSLATEHKGTYARNNGCALLLLEEDYERLDESSGKMVSSSVTDAKLPASLAEVTVWLRREASGRAYILPFSLVGKWQPTGTPWWKGLGAFLELTETGLLRRRAVPARTAAAAAQSATEPEPPVEIKSSTIGRLYEAALTSHPEYLRRFLARHRTLCDRDLFPGGVGEQALQRKDEIFIQLATGIVPDAHILIGGPTGCGKTFLTEALALNEVVERNSHAIYIGPTRSLVVERWMELREHLVFPDNQEFRDDDVLISTGEMSSSDWRLHRNRYRIAVLVNEKANLFLRPSTDFIRRLGLVIVDELHMLSQPTRGGVLDMLLAKIHEENIRRGQHGEPVLRVVGVTTEDAVSDPAVQSSFAIVTRGSEPRRPSIISTDNRPLPVEHVACVYRSRADELPAEIPITTFRSQADRLLDDSRCATISRQIVAEINRLERDSRPTKSYFRDERTPTVLSEVVLRYSHQGFQSLLVAHPSIPGLTDLARQIKNDRQRKGYEVQEDPYLVDQIKKGAVGRSVGETLIELSGFGVYVHHAELPRTVREVIERHFRLGAARSDGLCEILLATETLFYGVNLSVDCLLLSTPLWTRELPGDGELDQIELTSNEFHNILGRVGRPGYDKGIRAAKAIVCFPTFEYVSKLDAVHSLVQRYYGKRRSGPFRRALSSLITPEDLTANAEGTLSSLDSVCYPTFRSVLDALRHLGGSEKRHASDAEVLALCRKTVFFQTQGCTDEEGGSLIRKVLDLSADEGLIEKSGDRFRVRAEAEALIDTGTKWQSVAPMRRWLELLLGIKTQSAGVVLPSELLIPAFVSSPDLWSSSRTFCWEFYERNPRADLKRVTEDIGRRALRQELARLALSDATIDLVEKGVADLVQELTSTLPLDVPEYRKAVFYKLVAALLRWVRGVDTDEIAILSLKEQDPKRVKSEARQFKERYCERASWLATMCLRYFDKTDKLTAEHRRELPRLAQRLRQGVPAAGLAMVSQARTQLTRREVQVLIERGVTPGAILRTIDPLELVNGADVLIYLDQNRKREIIDDVHAYYKDQISALIDMMIDDRETQQACQDFRDLVVSCFESRSSGCSVTEPNAVSKHKFLDALVNLLNVRQRIRVVKQVPELRLRLIGSEGEGDGLTLGIRGMADPNSQPANADIAIRFPWSRSTDSAVVEVTACGGILLAYLIARGFLKSPVEVLRSWTQTMHGLATVQDLLELDMPSLPLELREAMLRFNEPGT